MSGRMAFDDEQWCARMSDIGESIENIGWNLKNALKEENEDNLIKACLDIKQAGIEIERYFVPGYLKYMQGEPS